MQIETSVDFLNTIVYVSCSNKLVLFFQKCKKDILNNGYNIIMNDTYAQKCICSLCDIVDNSEFFKIFYTTTFN